MRGVYKHLRPRSLDDARDDKDCSAKRADAIRPYICAMPLQYRTTAKAFPNAERHGCMLCTMGEGGERDNGAFDG